MKQIHLRPVADIKRLNPHSDSGIGVVERRLPQSIVLSRCRHPIKLPVGDPNSDDATLCIGHADNGFSKVFRLNPKRLPLKPLILRHPQEEIRIVPVIALSIHSSEFYSKGFRVDMFPQLNLETFPFE